MKFYQLGQTGQNVLLQQEVGAGHIDGPVLQSNQHNT